MIDFDQALFQIFTCSHNFLPAEVWPVKEREVIPRPVQWMASRSSRASPSWEAPSTCQRCKWPAANSERTQNFEIFWVTLCSFVKWLIFCSRRAGGSPWFPDDSSALLTTIWYATGFESWWHHKSRLPMTFPTIDVVTLSSVVSATFLTISARQTWSSSSGTPNASRPTTATTAEEVAGKTGSVGRGALNGNMREPSASTTQRSATLHKMSTHEGGIPTARSPCGPFSRAVTKATRRCLSWNALVIRSTASSRLVVSISESTCSGIWGTRTFVVVVNNAFRPATAPSFRTWKLSVVLPPPPTNAKVSGHPNASQRLSFGWPIAIEAETQACKAHVRHAQWCWPSV